MLCSKFKSNLFEDTSRVYKTPLLLFSRNICIVQLQSLHTQLSASSMCWNSLNHGLKCFEVLMCSSFINQYDPKISNMVEKKTALHITLKNTSQHLWYCYTVQCKSELQDQIQMSPTDLPPLIKCITCNHWPLDYLHIAILYNLQLYFYTLLSQT